MKNQKRCAVRVRVPASTANLGPGLDVFGLALGLYAEVTFSPAEDRFEFDIEGEGEETIRDINNNLVFRAAERLWKQTQTRPAGARISIRNAIPLCSGLGSSGAAIVAGLMGANAFSHGGLSNDELLTLATEIEGHPDNVAASLLGGLVLSTTLEDRVVALSYRCPEPLRVVVLYPRTTISTHECRKLLPRTVTFEEAIFNLGRAAHLAAAFSTGRLEEIPFAFDDRLHQQRRSVLMPYLFDAIAMARKAGALGAFLSGSGPSVAAFCRPERTEVVAEGFRAIQKQFRLEGEIYTPPIDDRGACLVP